LIQLLDSEEMQVRAVAAEWLRKIANRRTE